MPVEPESEAQEAAERAYFQGIEEAFVELRGTPFLLSPADWQVARRWQQDGVPLDLIRNAMAEVFAKRQERGAKGKISSLRYCAPAIEAAWDHLRELAVADQRGSASGVGLDLPGRLRALAAALPQDLPERETWAARIAGIAGAAGGSQAIEEGLAALDRELLDAASARLSGKAAKGVEETVERTLATLAGRLPDAELARSRDHLRRQILRKQLGLPVLSLFSPEAEGTALE